MSDITDITIMVEKRRKDLERQFGSGSGATCETVFQSAMLLLTRDGARRNRQQFEIGPTRL